MPLFEDFINILFPQTCAGCNNALITGEKYICTDCLYQLPRTFFWKETDNPVARLFWGRVYLENASSFFYFHKKSRLQNILHHLKYKNQKEIGFELGKMFGAELRDTPYSSADAIVPVPLHKSKLNKRGYNQSELIALGISEILDIPVNTEALKRVIASESQTRKSRFERWENVEKIFSLNDPDFFKDKHVLLVDDVLTTGATLEACASAILEVPNSKVSAVTIANAVI